MAKQGRRGAMKKFSADAMVEGNFYVYQKVIAEGRNYPCLKK